MPSRKKARLVLKDGSVFYGNSVGASKSVAGEVVFNTGMVGYPESLTDPSYKGQILVFTYPLIGNYGVPEDEVMDGLSQTLESDKIHVQGVIVSEYVDEYSHWRAKKSLAEWLEQNNIPMITGIDTRKLTQHLREEGVMLGKIVIDEDVDFYDPDKENLVEQVSTRQVYRYGDGEKKIIAIDCGIKHNIIRSFLKRGVQVIRVPWDFNFFNLRFDGLFISNGPGDPKQCRKTIDMIKRAMDEEIPTFGVCLGNQLMALASGAETYKLKYGHRSQNQPCLETGTKRCIITSQNHGYAVKSPPKGWEEWFVNANDNTNEGMRHKSKPFFSVQFHPESSPGPTDAAYLFDRFIEVLK